jgi:hypothetical protein
MITEEQYVNSRFGFSVSYPGALTGEESDNGDGIRLSDPTGELEVRCYAHAAVIASTFREWILDEILRERSKEDFEIVSTEDVTVMLQTSDNSTQRLPGSKIVYRWRSGGILRQAAWLFVQHDNTQFSVRYTGPVRMLPQFVSVLNRIQCSLKVQRPIET